MLLRVYLKYEGKTVSWVSKLNRKGSISRRFGCIEPQKFWKTKPILALSSKPSGQKKPLATDRIL
jgi:hypothetical protein